jgi:hypothetical protein
MGDKHRHGVAHVAMEYQAKEGRAEAGPAREAARKRAQKECKIRPRNTHHRVHRRALAPVPEDRLVVVETPRRPARPRALPRWITESTTEKEPGHPATTTAPAAWQAPRRPWPRR